MRTRFVLGRIVALLVVALPVAQGAGAEPRAAAATTALTAEMVKDLNPDSGFAFDALADSGGTLFFSGQGAAWRSDGTEPGTFPIASFSATGFTAAGTTTFFAGWGGLWRTDGTAAGTVLVRSFEGGAPSSLAAVGETLFFAADDGETGIELWRSDGTPDGTVLVRDIRPVGVSSPSLRSSEPGQLTAVGSEVLFAANDGIHGRELWRSDGTREGTVLVKDLDPEGSGGSFPTRSDPEDLVEAGGRLFFTAEVAGWRGLWTSDGSAAGTVPIDLGSPMASPSDLVAVGRSVLFAAYAEGVGRELWRSDGTPAGTALLEDIAPGPDSSSPGEFVSANGLVFFSADDDPSGRSYWRSDGTAAGTWRVGAPGLWACERTCAGPAAANGRAFFWGDDGATGPELWTSDGTDAGTVLVRDVYPGTAGSIPPFGVYPVVTSGTHVFFPADDGTHGSELWAVSLESGSTLSVADATATEGGAASFTVTLATAAAGTVTATYLTVDATASAGSDYPFSTGTVVFTPGTTTQTVPVPSTSDTTVEGEESFELRLAGVDGALLADGLAVGTILDDDAGPSIGVADASVTEGDAGTVAAVFDVVLSGPSPDPVTVRWTTRGGGARVDADFVGASGTLAFDPGTTTLPVSVVVLGETLDEPDETFVLELHGPVGATLADATATGTILDDDAAPALSVSDAAVTEGDSGTGRADFLVSLGAPSGRTVTVAYATADGTATAPADYVSVSGILTLEAGVTAATIRVPVAADAVYEPVESFTLGLHSPGNATIADAQGVARVLDDDDETGLPSARLLKDVNPYDGSAPRDFVDVGGAVFFESGSGLWKTDGTDAGTTLVMTSGASSLTAVGDTLFFVGGDEGQELWKSDGTETGTVQVADIHPGASSSNPGALTAHGGLLYFAADDGVHGPELWRSDGTEAGTVLVADIWPGEGGSSPWQLTSHGGALFFVASDESHGRELWRSDGTAAGTVLVKDVRDGSADALGPGSCLVSGQAALFFSAFGTLGQELWASDGTEAGTVSLMGPFPVIQGDCGPRFASTSGQLFFAAASSEDSGPVLWKSDGTPVGTVAVKDIWPGFDGGNSWLSDLEPHGFAAMDGFVLFFADDGVHGQELWRSDGTAEGTVLVKDLNLGPRGQDAWVITRVGNRALFGANDGAHGTEPWSTDGTTAGTAMVRDVNPGSPSSVVWPFVASDGRAFFAADDGVHGEEPWIAFAGPQARAGKPVFWRHSDGSNAAWTVDGQGVAAGALLPLVPGPDWQVAGDGDLDGDGDADLVWRNAATGEDAVWLLDHEPVVQVSGAAWAPTVFDAAWRVALVADLDGDRRDDLLWRREGTGEMAVWLMHGASVVASGFLPTLADASWVPAAADLDGDGRDEVVWRHAISGETAAWFLDGVSFVATAPLPSLAPEWTLAAVGDRDGDGRDDLLWRHGATGQNAVWLMHGTAVASGGYLPAVSDAGWSIEESRDWNGDGRDEVLWRDAGTGRLAVWSIDGTVLAAGVELPPVSDGNWAVAGSPLR